MHEEQPSSEREGAPTVPSRVYVASLSDYNDGRLHGAWIEAAQEPNDLHDEVEAMLHASPLPGAEEWAIHDYEGFGPLPLSEYESLERVSQLAQGIALHGEAFAAFAAHEDADLSESSFEARYQGRWDSLGAYAEDLLDQLGATEILESLPEWLGRYVSLDIEQFGRELEMGGDIETVRSSDGGVFVFTSEA